MDCSAIIISSKQKKTNTQSTKDTHSIHSIENMKGMKIKRKARVIPLGQ